MKLNHPQITYLKELLQTSSVETLSPGIASALLHLKGLEPAELLTLSLICAGLWYDHEEATSALTLLRSSDAQEAADTFTLLSNILAEQAENSRMPGNSNEVLGLQDAGSLTADLALPDM